MQRRKFSREFKLEAVRFEASRVFWRLLSVRRSPHDDKEQVFA
jgi:hypothetical protein